MNTRILTRALLPSLAVALAACDQPATTGPESDDTLLSVEEGWTLAVLSAPDAIDAGVALAELPIFVTEDRDASAASAGWSLLAEARATFEDAARARTAGDDRAALAHAEAARKLLAQALDGADGTAAATVVVERSESLAAEVAAEPEAYTEVATLETDLRTLAARARDRLARGDRRGAVSDAIVAEQLRQLHRRPSHDRDRVDLALALARTSIELATRLLPDDADPAQLRFLRVAERHLRAAEALAESGHPARAVHQAELAVWSALKAVVVPGGVSEAEQRQILDLAQELFVAARATDPQGVRETLLRISGRLLERGTAQLEAGNVRGITALWSSAVISSWIIS